MESDSINSKSAYKVSINGPSNFFVQLCKYKTLLKEKFCFYFRNLTDKINNNLLYL